MEETENRSADLHSECEREPVHIPGAIQPHGVLLAFREDDLTATQVSANCEDVLDIPADAILGRNASEVFPAEARALVEEVLRDAESTFANPWQIPMTVRGESLVFDGVVHRVDGLVVLELENAVALESTGDPGRRAVDPYFRLVADTLAGVRGLETENEMCEVLARKVRDFTGFERVMIYRFAPDGHGEVIGESIAEGMESFLGLHYPASDIPEQARRLYLLNWLRLIADVDYAPVPLVPELNSVTGKPLDMTHSVLRSVSPVHIEYLKNMGVGSSMSISLVRGDTLWGLIACHSSVARHVPYDIRAACELLGTVMSAQFAFKENSLYEKNRARLQSVHTKVLNSIAASGNVVEGLSWDVDELLGTVDADGAALFFDGTLTLAGRTPDEASVQRLLQWLDSTLEEKALYSTNQLPSEWPEGEDCAAEASGLLALKFWPEDYLLFFRGEAAEHIRWGGDPSKAVTQLEDGRLQPRASFEEYIESVAHRSTPWGESELSIARECQSSIGVFLLRRSREMERLNRSVREKNDEIEELVYSVSHDLRSPLVTCQGFIGLLKEDLADGDMEAVLDSAERIQGATAQMNRLIEALLDHSRVGRVTAATEDLDVSQLVNGLRERYTQRLDESGAVLQIAERMPRVKAAAIDLERVFDNLIVNAIKYGCEDGNRLIEVGGETGDGDVRFYVGDHGPGIDPRYHAKVFRLFQRLDTTKEGTGVGLATVAKILQIYGGKVWLESAPGEGAKFWISFPEAERDLRTID